MDVQGTSAIVTGGASGLGAGTARALAAAGVKVAIFDMNMDSANEVAEEIGGMAIECDVSDASSTVAAVSAAQRSKRGSAETRTPTSASPETGCPNQALSTPSSASPWGSRSGW